MFKIIKRETIYLITSVCQSSWIIVEHVWRNGALYGEVDALGVQVAARTSGARD